jgi:ABC-type nitrate/sulfonate/bicarbonate transport system substrate-binding protein
MEKLVFDRRGLLATGAAAIGLGASASAWAQARPESGRLALGFGLDPVFAPHIVAMEKGWLRDAGFSQIETKSFTGGALAGEALISGDIQLWTPGNLPPVSMAHGGIPIVVLGTNCVAAAADNLVARKDADIKAPEDLYRIKIGLLAGSTASAMLHAIAKHYGLDEKRLQVVNMPPPEQMAGLRSNAVQALLCWQPWGHNALALGDTMLVHSGVASGFERNRGQTVRVSATRSLFVASQDYVRRNPNAVNLMMAALVRAQGHVADPANRAEVVALVAEKTRQDRALVEAIWGQYVFDPTFDDAFVADMKAMTDYLVASGRIRAARDPLDYTYSAPAVAGGAKAPVPGRWRA